ncbi:hypothetical protein B0H11DRAFT_1904980 [Mycena galericulata]|nr:hypothetical protein B0H11DRAFT_1904980 [Mycena galericulata]
MGTNFRNELDFPSTVIFIGVTRTIFLARGLGGKRQSRRYRPRIPEERLSSSIAISFTLALGGARFTDNSSIPAEQTISIGEQQHEEPLPCCAGRDLFGDMPQLVFPFWSTKNICGTTMAVKMHIYSAPTFVSKMKSGSNDSVPETA